MTYDPFARGPHPVGVRTTALTDAARAHRPVVVETWYPADDAYAGADRQADSRDSFEVVPGFPPATQEAVRDAAPRTGRHPLVVFSHGLGGHRRQSTFLCTHLASHGYVVGACDHGGTTMLDLFRLTLKARQRGERTADDQFQAHLAGPRPADLRFVIDALLDDRAAAVSALLDADRIGATGHSLGGWTALVVTQQDARIRATVPLAPAGGRTHVRTTELRDALGHAPGRDVPGLWIVADRDSVLPLDGIEALYADVRGPKRMVVLSQADHMHFCDRAEHIHELFRTTPPPGVFTRASRSMAPIAELTPPARTFPIIRGLTLAHFDAVLRADERAAAWLGAGLAAALDARGVGARVV